jgi:hypothetical protein
MTPHAASSMGVVPQAPPPSQRLQVPHATVLSGYWQPRAPLQVPPQVPVPGHSSAGSWPAGIGQQVPTWLVTLHASQRPAHAVWQQTPSAQVPLAQVAAPPVQSSPLLSLQAPAASQVRVPVQVSSSAFFTAVQVPGLPVTLQAWQVPHAAALQQTWSTQLPDRHSAPRSHGEPSVPWVLHAGAWQKAPALQSASEAQEAPQTAPAQA